MFICSLQSLWSVPLLHPNLTEQDYQSWPFHNLHPTCDFFMEPSLLSSSILIFYKDVSGKMKKELMPSPRKLPEVLTCRVFAASLNTKLASEPSVQSLWVSSHLNASTMVWPKFCFWILGFFFCFRSQFTNIYILNNFYSFFNLKSHLQSKTSIYLSNIYFI